MRTVPRHETDGEHSAKAVRRLVSRWHESREDIETDRLGPGFAMERAYREFAHRTEADPGAAANETWFALVRALQAGAAMFLAAATPEGEEIEFRFGEDTIRRQATGPTGDVDAIAWLKTMYLAIIARDRARAELLATVPLDMVRQAEPRYDEFVFSWIRALRRHTLGGDDLIDTVLAAMRGAEPGGEDGLPADAIQRLYYPPIELFYRYTQREKTHFADSLHTALDLHRRFWAGQESSARHQEGFVALAPLAMACLAHDAGMPVEVASEYLPHHLVTGTWVGETTT